MRGSFLMLIVPLLGASLSGSALPHVPTAHSESFEAGWGDWTADHHVECEESGTCVLEWSLERSEGTARTGAWSLESYINGILDDGVVWAEAAFDVGPGTEIPVLLVFHVRSDAYSDVNNWQVVGYLGPDDPEREEDFVIVGFTDRGVGWRSFCLPGIVTPGADGKVWAGAGISVTWEGPRTYHMDDFSVGIDHSAAGCPTWPVCIVADLEVCGDPVVPGEP